MRPAPAGAYGAAMTTCLRVAIAACAALVLVLALAPSAAAAPGDPPLARNAVYVEGFGAGLTYSIDYERLVSPVASVRLGWGYDSLGGVCGYGAGCAWLAGSPSAENSPSANLTMIPVTASYLGLRRGHHVLELGGGVTLAVADHVRGMAIATGGFAVAFAGYRYQPSCRGVQFRIGASLYVGPGFGRYLGGDPLPLPVFPWGYTSVGFAF